MTKLIKFITLGEFKQVLTAEKKKEYKLGYSLAFGSGLRLSEVVGLKKPDGSWKIKPLTQEQVDLKAHQIKVIGGKGLKDRITVTSPWLNETNIKLLPLDIERRAIQKKFTTLCKRVLNKEYSFHSLRHGFANFQANERKLPLAYLQALLGHSRLDTTGIYLKANPLDAIKQAYENF